MSEPTGPRLRLRFVYRNVLMPVGLSPADVVSSSGTFLKVRRTYLTLNPFTGGQHELHCMHGRHQYNAMLEFTAAGPRLS